jgi:hypothetical protein
MSDFLTNLAARTLGAPTLRPRTRSRFEPEAEASPWIEAPAEPAMPPHTPQNESTSVRTDEPARKSLPESTTPRRVDHSATRRRPLENEIAPRSREVRESSSAAAAPPLLKTDVVPTHSRTVATHTEHHTKERVVERRVEHHDHTTVRVERETPGRSVAESTIERADDDMPTPRLAESAPRHRYDEQPPRIERERREAMPAHEPRPVPPQRARIEAVAAPEPTIHVSIGRVEVRAAAPAATPHRTRARNAPMTLEDYAARRSAKGRP